MSFPIIERTSFEAGDRVRARDARAWYRCDRCAFPYYKDELMEDGEKPGLLVCDECFDPFTGADFGIVSVYEAGAYGAGAYGAGIYGQ